jgi:hypothetical protein
MPVTNDNFDQLKIDKLRHYLEDMAAKGHPKPYEIFVDALKVVPKTEDPKEFDGYEYYMNENTEKIRILIYNSQLTNRNDQYCFYVQKNAADKPLNGLGDLDGIIQEKLAAREREYEVNKLKEELEETKKQLEEAEEYSEQLEQELEVVKSNKFKLGSIHLGELASYAMESIVRRNPQMLTKIPGGEALAGIIEQDNAERDKKKLDSSPIAEAEASFSKRATVAEGLSEEQKRQLAFIEQLQGVFSEEQLQSVMHIIEKLAADPTQIISVSKLLNI